MLREQSGITHQHVERYLYDVLPRRDKILSELEKKAERDSIPIVGPLVGRLLYLLVKASRSRKILEIGTAIGYSTIWLARGASENQGHVETIEIDPRRCREAKMNIERASLVRYVKILPGDAREVLHSLNGEYDFVFLDAGDKTEYPRFLDLCLKLLRRGGIMVTDNCLWKGLVATEDTSAEVRILREYNLAIMKNPLLETVILPVRDGISIAYKNS